MGGRGGSGRAAITMPVAMVPVPGTRSGLHCELVLWLSYVPRRVRFPSAVVIPGGAWATGTLMLPLWALAGVSAAKAARTRSNLAIVLGTIMHHF